MSPSSGRLSPSIPSLPVSTSIGHHFPSQVSTNSFCVKALDMEPSALQKAIANETLPNDKALLELYTRRDYYADSEPSKPNDAKMLRLFELSILDAKKAIAAHEPVVVVLKKVLLDVGRLAAATNKAEKQLNHVENNSKHQVSPTRTMKRCLRLIQ
jgi:hypothetical protein